MSAVGDEDMAIVQAKKELRKRIKNILSGMNHENISSQTNVVLDRLFALPEYKSARSISVFLSMPVGEISTKEIVHHALDQGKRIFIPYTFKLSPQRDFWPSSVMDMVQLRSVQDYESLKPDKWGIPSPSRDSIGERPNCFGGFGTSDGEAAEEPADSELDLIVMPGLAFDRNLERLGHGKGYYDFFLQRYLWHTQKAHIKMPFLVALALKEQVLSSEDQVPADATDYKLDAIILGDGEVIRSSSVSD